MLFYIKFFCLVSSLIIGSRALDLPHYFPKCCLKDPNLNECLFNAANIVRPYILNGIEEIQLPSLNPYVLAAFTATNNAVNANFTVSMKNFTLYGLENYKIISLGYDPLLLKLSGNVEFPQLYYESLHEAIGTVIQIDVTSNGSLSAFTGPCKALFEIDGELVTRGNEIYFNPVVVKIPLIIDSIKGRIRRLLNANEEIENLTNRLINENPSQLGKLLTPVFQELFESLVYRYVKFITNEIPYNRIFPCLF